MRLGGRKFVSEPQQGCRGWHYLPVRIIHNIAFVPRRVHRRLVGQRLMVDCPDTAAKSRASRREKAAAVGLLIAAVTFIDVTVLPIRYGARGDSRLGQFYRLRV